MELFFDQPTELHPLFSTVNSADMWTLSDSHISSGGLINVSDVGRHCVDLDAGEMYPIRRTVTTPLMHGETVVWNLRPGLIEPTTAGLMKEGSGRPPPPAPA